MHGNNSAMNIIQKLHNDKFRSDEIFNQITAEYIRITSNELQLSDRILRSVILDMLLQHMKKDRIFNDLFENIKYAGSVSKNLKIYKPNEYDLNIVIHLSINYNFLAIEPDHNKHGYVKIRATRNCLNGYTDICSKIMTGHYLDQDKFRSWMHSVVINALNSIQSNHSLINNTNLYRFKSCKKTYEVRYRQSNPAFTLQVTRKANNYNVDFDLVPCLRFEHKAVDGFRQPIGNNWIAISKPLIGVDGGNFLWRAGFYESEKQLLKRLKKGQLKPIIRMFKKFRDDQEWTNIKSYFIETLFYNELSYKNFKRRHCQFSRTSVFVYMLMRLEENLKAKVLQSYWHKRLNLFDSLSPEYTENLAAQLNKILSMIKYNRKDNGWLVKTGYFREMLQI